MKISRLAQGIIVIVCVTGFYLGLRSTRPAPSVASNTANAPLTETLQRTQSELGAVRDWFAELKAAATNKDDGALDRLRKGPLATLTPAQIEEVVRLIDAETDSFHRARMVDAIAERWATLDPEAALAFVTKRIHRNRQQKPYTKMLKTVAKTDGAKAYALLLSTEEANAKSVWGLGESAFEVFREWKKSSMDAGFEALEEGRIHEANADAALYAMCRAESPEEREHVLEHVRDLTDPELQRKAWGKVVYSWAKTAPLEEVVTWMDDEAFPPETVATMEREIASRKAKDNPSEMANWLAERASPESLPKHLETAVQTWAYAQPNACAEWLHTLELGPQTDRAVAAFAHASAGHDFESAFNWAQSIHESTLREQTLSEMAKRMHRLDPSLLSQLVSNSALDADLQARLLKSAE